MYIKSTTTIYIHINTINHLLEQQQQISINAWYSRLSSTSFVQSDVQSR